MLDICIAAPRHGAVLTVRLAAAALVSAASLAHGAALLAPGAPIASLSQSYLSAQWTQWSLLYPAATNPVLDTTGAQSALGDQGSYFFLAGAFVTDPVVRDVTVRSDQTLFFPLVSLVSTIPAFGSTEAEIRADASDNLGTIGNLSVRIDGTAAELPAGTASLDAYRQASPLFPLMLAADNIYGLPQQVVPAVSDGVFVGVAPLAAGMHEIHFTASAQGQGAYSGFVFSQDITYRVSVVPEPPAAAAMAAGLLLLAALRLRRPVRPAG